MKKITRLFLVVIMFAFGVNSSFADNLGDAAQSKMMVAMANQKTLTPEQCTQAKNLVEKTFTQKLREIDNTWYYIGPTKDIAKVKVMQAVVQIRDKLKPKCKDIKICVYGLPEKYFPECVNRQGIGDKLVAAQKEVQNAMAYAAGNPTATVTVNRRAVEYLIDAMVRQYRSDLSKEQQSGVIEAATIEFQKRLTKENKITAGDVAKLCSLMFKAANDNTCSTFNKKIANTMRFVRPCTNPKAKGAGLCLPKFKDVDAQYRDALGLIRLEYFMKNGKDEVYCRSKTEELSNQDYMACKTFDGTPFEVEFDDLTESYQDRIVKDVSIAATKIIWGGRCKVCLG